MKRSIILFSMLFALQTVLAQTPYFRAGVGISSLSDAKVTAIVTETGLDPISDSTDIEYDSDISLQVAMGLDYENGYKLELHFSTQENEGSYKVDRSDKVEQKSTTLGLNIVREFDRGRWVPFVNAGAGFVFTEFKDDFFDEGVVEKIKDTTMALNVGGGITYSLSDTLDFYGKYNYYMSGDIEDRILDVAEGTVDGELELGLHQFVVGITQSF